MAYMYPDLDVTCVHSYSSTNGPLYNTYALGSYVHEIRESTIAGQER